MITTYQTDLAAQETKSRDLCRCHSANENNKNQRTPSINNSGTSSMVLEGLILARDDKRNFQLDACMN